MTARLLVYVLTSFVLGTTLIQEPFVGASSLLALVWIAWNLETTLK